MQEEFLWVEKYRPKTIEDTILPPQLKKIFQQFVEQDNIPNLLLHGGAGVGKTTVARAMLEEMGCDYIVINGSMNGNIDTLRNDIQRFCSTVSFSGTRKYVILDEADYLNPQSTQPALRNFMEEYSANCGFILTCNFKDRIISPLHSRCSVVNFAIDKAHMPAMAAGFNARVLDILTQENVKFDKRAVAETIIKYYPDARRILNELQGYSATGAIDTGILSNIVDESFNSLVDMIKKKSFTKMRQWVADNADVDSTELFRKFYDQAHTVMTTQSIPTLVQWIGEYQYKGAMVPDKEINTCAFLTMVMTDADIEWI